MSETVKIKITTDTHTHQDKPFPKGGVLEVDLETARQFIAVGAADPVTTNDLKKEG